MPAIDRWVIRTTFAWMAENKDKVDAMGGVAINLSGRSLIDDTFKDFILEEVQKTGASMDRVCFEVTETAGIDNLTDAAEFILDMKKSGCTFALDDFGSGLSSYAYLKNLPVDFLKIDGAFVKEMDRNPSDFAVVKSISEIGHFMGKKIIAEYVENETILGMLREIGVDYAQGYVIDKPRRLFDFTG
jgi:EAL domain-containing protein (putative c-di-GMP-specific phosphodiesterase class I)